MNDDGEAAASFHSVREGELLVIQASGEMDMAVTETLVWEILSAMSGGDGVSAVAVDMSAVTFADTAFIRTIIATDQALARAGVPVRVRNLSAEARRLFDVTELSHFIAD
jgi:anti-anti-sigma factor